MADYIGIGGIIATIGVGLLTCLVTWLVTKKSLISKRLTYEVKLIPILSRNIQKQVNDFKIYYKDVELKKPCLLMVDIVNSGNCSINNPPIKILIKGADFIVPGYLEDIPSGYENMWSLNKIDNSECELNIDHINKKQIVKARILMDRYPLEIPKVICPMMDVVIKEYSFENAFKSINNIALGRVLSLINKI